MRNLENNRLIAEFMNYNLEIVNNEVYFTHDDMLESLSDEELHFDTDWNWLMEVVGKILTVGDDTNQWDSVLNELQSITIKNVYEACIEFINWHNGKN